MTPPERLQDVTLADLRDYDAGLLNDFGGGNVEWWQDYLRAEIERANEYWRVQVEAAAALSVRGEPVAWGVRCQHKGNLWTTLTDEADAKRIANNCGDTAVPLYATPLSEG